MPRRHEPRDAFVHSSLAIAKSARHRGSAAIRQEYMAGTHCHPAAQGALPRQPAKGSRGYHREYYRPGVKSAERWRTLWTRSGEVKSCPKSGDVIPLPSLLSVGLLTGSASVSACTAGISPVVLIWSFRGTVWRYSSTDASGIGMGDANTPTFPRLERRSGPQNSKGTLPAIAAVRRRFGSSAGGFWSSGSAKPRTRRLCEGASSNTWERAPAGGSLESMTS